MPRPRTPKIIRLFAVEGTIIEINGQEYRLIGFRPHTTKAGREISLAIWHTACAECGVEFDCTQEVGALPGTRRCQEHKAPGRPVRKRPLGLRIECSECGKEYIAAINKQCPRCGKIDIADNVTYELHQLRVQ